SSGQDTGAPSRDGAATAGRSGRPSGDNPPAGAQAARGGTGGSTPRRVEFTARVEIDHRAERKQVFHEAWRVMKHRFYDSTMPGDFILAVDGRELKAGDNYWQHFTAPVSGRFEFTVNAKPTTEGAWTTKVTPVGIMPFANLQYEKWVADRRAMVDKLSGGTIG